MNIDKDTKIYSTYATDSAVSNLECLVMNRLFEMFQKNCILIPRKSISESNLSDKIAECIGSNYAGAFLEKAIAIKEEEYANSTIKITPVSDLCNTADTIVISDTKEYCSIHNTYLYAFNRYINDLWDENIITYDSKFYFDGSNLYDKTLKISLMALLDSLGFCNVYFAKGAINEKEPILVRVDKRDFVECPSENSPIVINICDDSYDIVSVKDFKLFLLYKVLKQFNIITNIGVSGQDFTELKTEIIK